jgi:hypothetical protein
MNGSTTNDSHPTGVIDSVNALGTNLGTLASLQARLAVCDLRESLLRMTPALILGAFAVLVLPASVIVALFGIGYWVAMATSLSLPQAFLSVAAVGLIVAVLAFLLAVRLSRGCLTSFRRSAEELQRNVAWVRTVMKYSGR